MTDFMLSDLSMTMPIDLHNLIYVSRNIINNRPLVIQHPTQFWPYYLLIGDNVLTLFELCLTSFGQVFHLFEITLKPRPASPTRAARSRS